VVEDSKYVVVFALIYRSRDLAHAPTGVWPLTQGGALFWWITRLVLIVEHIWRYAYMRRAVKTGIYITIEATINECSTPTS